MSKPEFRADAEKYARQSIVEDKYYCDALAAGYESGANAAYEAGKLAGKQEGRAEAAEVCKAEAQYASKASLPQRYSGCFDCEFKIRALSEREGTSG